MPRVLTVLLALALAPAALAPADALAQGSMSEAFKGFGANRKDPIQIEADSLEVRDKESVALFSGNVLVRQSQTVMKAARLKVFYDSKPGQEGGAGLPSNQQFRRLEAEGRVTISQGDQTVTGEQGWFDMKSEEAMVTGGVVLTQGKNVARGERLAIDMKTGQYRLDAAKGSGRVQLTLEPAAAKGAGGKP
jgi:lipopolysaccharide export system protein LptA